VTLSELIISARDWLDDRVRPYLWPDAELARYANQAVEEACRRAELLTDTLSIPVTSGIADYPLEPSVSRVIRARLQSQTNPMTQWSVLKRDRAFPTWDSSSGRPVIFIVGPNAIQLLPIPDADDTLNLSVARGPLAKMVGPNDIPEIPATLHEGLIAWMCRCAFRKKDADTQSLNEADRYEEMFTRRFGLPQCAAGELASKINPSDIPMVSRGFGG
jgi:hypothetical protein